MGIILGFPRMEDMHMKKGRRVSTLTFLTVAFFAFSLMLTGQTIAAEKGDDLKVKGQVKAVTNKAKTVSVKVKGKGLMLFKFNDSTKFINFTKTKEIKYPTAVVVKYKVEGPNNVALSIKKALISLPKGVTEIKTDEVAALVEKGPDAGNYFLVDARPVSVASAAHIPTAVSIPVPLLKKKGKELLPTDKSKLLIFYCGGPT
jgi:hypothetical protein